MISGRGIFGGGSNVEHGCQCVRLRARKEAQEGVGHRATCGWHMIYDYYSFYHNYDNLYFCATCG